MTIHKHKDKINARLSEVKTNENLNGELDKLSLYTHTYTWTHTLLHEIWENVRPKEVKSCSRSQNKTGAEPKLDFTITTPQRSLSWS